MTSRSPASASVFPGFDALGDTSAGSQQIMAGLTQRRVQLGLTQSEVAALMGTSQSSVARIESGGADLRLSTLQRYAQAVQADLGFAVRPQPDR